MNLQLVFAISCLLGAVVDAKLTTTTKPKVYGCTPKEFYFMPYKDKACVKPETDPKYGWAASQKYLADVTTSSGKCKKTLILVNKKPLYTKAKCDMDKTDSKKLAELKFKFYSDSDCKTKASHHQDEDKKDVEEYDVKPQNVKAKCYRHPFFSGKMVKFTFKKPSSGTTGGKAGAFGLLCCCLICCPCICCLVIIACICGKGKSGGHRSNSSNSRKSDDHYEAMDDGEEQREPEEGGQAEMRMLSA